MKLYAAILVLSLYAAWLTGYYLQGKLNEHDAALEMNVLKNVKVMCDRKDGLPQLMLGSEFYYCRKVSNARH